MQRIWFSHNGVVRLTHLLHIFLVASMIWCCVALFNSVDAQITPDGTLGAERSVVTPNININGLISDQIDGGATRGQNLFHSFREFNVQEGRGAYFSNPQDIQNILSRVTGKNHSDILGTLGVLGDANLYFINPNGIVFGPNARLDVRGSFVGSTANSVQFEDGTEFSAVDPQAPPLLTINIPIGLQFRETHAETIRSSGGLAAGQNLKLSAGNLELEGQLYAGQNLTLQAQDTVKVRDSTTDPFMAAAGKDLLLEGKKKVDIFALNHTSSGLFSRGETVFHSDNPIVGDAHFWSGGNFRTERLDGSLGDLSSLYDPIIRSQGDVSFFGYLGSSLHILAGGSVDINTAIITGTDTLGDTINPTVTPILANFPLSDGTPLKIDGSARPTLDIRAGMDPKAIGTPLGSIGDGSNDIFFDSSFFIVPSPTNDPNLTSADITIGNVLIDPPNGLVYLSNQYEPNPSLPGGEILVAGSGIDSRGFGGDGSDVILDSRSDITLAGSFIDTSSMFEGNGADITLLASGDISLTNGARLESKVGKQTSRTVGDSGNIKIVTGTLEATTGASLRSRVYGEGNAGSVTITAKESVVFDGRGGVGRGFTGVSSNVPEGTVGNAGGIEIKARSLEVTNGAFLSSSTFGEGAAGGIRINARDSVIFDGALDGIAASVGSNMGPDAVGKSEGVEISTGSLAITNGAILSADTAGNGNVAGVRINARDNVKIDRFSDVKSRVEEGALGSSGGIEIITGSLSVTNGSRLSATSVGEGNAGLVIINARDKILLDSSNVISQIASPTAVGDSGGITIDTGLLEVINGAQLNATTFGQGNAGLVAITARDSVVLDGLSMIFSRVGEKSVGSSEGIEINTDSLSITNGAQLSASTFGEGNAGLITIIADEHVLFHGERLDETGTVVPSAAFSAVGNEDFPTAMGEAGGIEITTEYLEVMNGAILNSSLFGRGKAGSITINATGSVLFDGERSDGRPSAATSRVNSGAVGNSGGVTISASSVEVRNGAQLAATTKGEGDSGLVKINANESVLFDGEKSDGTPSAVFSQVGGGGRGDSNGIEINADLIALTNGAVLSTTTFGQGNAGSVKIIARENVVLDGERSLSKPTTIASTVSKGAKGDSGSIEVSTGSLSALNGAQLTVSTDSEGNAGDIRINARENILFDGRTSGGVQSAAFNQVLDEAIGKAGTITINARSLSVTNGARLSTNSRGDGPAGNIEITTKKDIHLGNQAVVRSDTVQGAGNITLRPRDLILRQNSQITTNASGPASGGNIEIKAKNLIALENSDITANSEEATGGRVSIRANGIFGTQFRNRQTPQSDITATSALGPEFSGIVGNRDHGA